MHAPGKSNQPRLNGKAGGTTSASRRIVKYVGCIIALLGMLMLSTPAANATGRAYVPGPGGTVVQIDWQTVSRTSTVENLWVQVSGATAARGNQCGTGMSVWYYDANWVKRNIYQARDYCTWGPVFSFWTPTFAAHRGSCVQVTYRMDLVWRNGTTFCIS